MRQSLGFVIGLCSAVIVSASACRFGAVARPERLRVGVIAPATVAAGATSSSAALQAQFAPFVSYLQRTLGLPINLDGTRDLAALTADFEAGQFDLAFLGAVDFVRARERHRAVPLVTRESDRFATVVFLASATDPRATLQEFKGATLSFGPRVSSSHVMGRYYLEKGGIDPESFFGEVRHSANSDDTALLAARGEVDLVATGSIAYAQLLTTASLKPGQLNVVWETPPYVTSVWAASATLPADLVAKIRDAFLGLSPGDPAHAAILSSLNATGFLPVSDADYAALTTLMRRLKLLEP